jgi:arylsulfatase A-like enzyme
VDDQIRRLVNPVTGVDRMTGRNTVVMLTSDHGEMLGDHYLWRKTLPYEPSARIPLLVNAPERFGLQTGGVREEAVDLADIMPTILEMADLPIPDGVDGVSLLPLLRGENMFRREYIHIEHAPVHHTLTDGREKYIWFVSDGLERFFDLQEDPCECHDLARDIGSADRIAVWRERLVRDLAERPEGFAAGGRLVPGRPYPAILKPAGGPGQHIQC